MTHPLLFNRSFPGTGKKPIQNINSQVFKVHPTCSHSAHKYYSQHSPKANLYCHSAWEPYYVNCVSRLSAVLYLQNFLCNSLLYLKTTRYSFTILPCRQSKFIICSTPMLNCNCFTGVGNNEYCVLVFKSCANNLQNYGIICDIEHINLMYYSLTYEPSK